MNNLETIQKECRFGIPSADQVLFNRHYTVGYSYFLRQAKWALEIVNPATIYEFHGDDHHVERADNFRRDFRIPVQFRADLIDFKGSGYDRGHLVPSGNQRDYDLQNSETFLLSNMSPQKGDLNRFKWRELEEEIRKLDAKEDIFQTFVVTGPIIDLSKATEFIGINEEHKPDFSEDYEDIDVTIPVPNAYFKSVLTENKGGRYHMWSFIMENQKQPKAIQEYQVTTKQVELMAGIRLWPNLQGDQIEAEKGRLRTMW